MDKSPDIDELLNNIRFEGSNRVAKLAEELGVKNARSLNKIRDVFEAWIKNDRAQATRRRIVSGLRNIGELQIAKEYLDYCQSLEERKNFDEFQNEYESLNLRIMQCIPLGPPRVGKTCLKRRLLQQPLKTTPRKSNKYISTRSPSTPIATEKQTILVKPPGSSTLLSDGKKVWKAIKFEEEIVKLVHMIQSTPNIVCCSLKSFDILFCVFAVALFIFNIIVSSSTTNLILIPFFTFFAARRFKSRNPGIPFYVLSPILLKTISGSLLNLQNTDENLLLFSEEISMVITYLLFSHACKQTCKRSLLILLLLVCFFWQLRLNICLWVLFIYKVFFYLVIRFFSKKKSGYAGYIEIVIRVVKYFWRRARRSNKRKALLKLKVIQGKGFSSDSLTMFFTDCGGQPEFQEVLPALLSGPTVFFLIFDLAHGLDALYEVEYVDEAQHRCSIPYTSTFTVLEAMLQCLATIACIGQYSKTKWRKNYGIKPKVFFIGTHRDLVKDEDIGRLEKQLREGLKLTSWYKKEMIQFASSESLIFAVNNFEKSDNSFIKIREAVDLLAQNTSDYTVKIPVSSLALELSLRDHHKKTHENVISFSECLKISSECNIMGKEDLKDDLLFLHNRIGTLRYYHQIPDLSEVVIINPQVLIRIVTDLIVSTFPHSTGRVRTDFKETGRFSEDELKRIGKIDGTGLNVSQVLALLQYLHILAPLGESNQSRKQYFLPCVLTHAPIANEMPATVQDLRLSSILLISFKCGYTPKGMFSALISYLLQHKHHNTKWDLDERNLFRNQATFVAGDKGYCVTITHFSKFLEVKLFTPEGQDIIVNRNSMQEEGSMCRIVLNAISQGLDLVATRLNYTCDADHIFGFYCSHSNCQNTDKHPALCTDNKKPQSLRCVNKSSNTLELSAVEKQWFSSYQTRDRTSMFTKVKCIVKKHWKIIALILVCLFFLFAPIKFDIHRLSQDHSVVKQHLLKHYNMLCNTTNGLDGAISCEIYKVLSNNEQLKPMRPTRCFKTAFSNLQLNCSMTVIATFHNCFPKFCTKNPILQVQDGLILSLQACPLPSNICWPIMNSLGGTEAAITTMMRPYLPDFIWPVHSMLRDPILDLGYFIYYTLNPISDTCTKDLQKILRKKTLELGEILDFLNFVVYTDPSLAPIIVLSQLDKASKGPPYPSNSPLDKIVSELSSKMSASNWLIPVIATASNETWFNTAEINNLLMYEYFPFNVTC